MSQFEKDMRNLAKDLVMNQKCSGILEGVSMPSHFNFPNGLAEEEYYELLLQKNGQK